METLIKNYCTYGAQTMYSNYGAQTKYIVVIDRRDFVN